MSHFKIQTPGEQLTTSLLSLNRATTHLHCAIPGYMHAPVLLSATQVRLHVLHIVNRESFPKLYCERRIYSGVDTRTPITVRLVLIISTRPHRIDRLTIPIIFIFYFYVAVELQYTFCHKKTAKQHGSKKMTKIHVEKSE